MSIVNVNSFEAVSTIYARFVGLVVRINIFYFKVRVVIFIIKLISVANKNNRLHPPVILDKNGRPAIGGGMS